MFYILFLCILLYTSSLQDDTSIIAMRYNLFLNALSVYIHVGSEKNILVFTIDTESSVSRLTDYLYIGEPSTTEINHGNISMKVANGILKGILYEDSVFIENNSYDQLIAEVKGFYFGLIPSKEQDIEIDDASVLAFAFKVDKVNYSLVHLYKQNKLIKYKQFGIYRDMDKIFSDSRVKDGILYIGGFPSNIIKLLYENSIPIINNHNNNFWNVPLQYIIIGNHTHIYSAKKYIAYISTSKEDIIVPFDFFNSFILNNYFNNKHMKESCILNPHRNHKISCNCDKVNSFSNISFVINNKEFIIESQHLFKKEDSKCKFILSSNNNKNSKHFIFGIYFIWQYQTLFDYDNNQILFYSHQQFPLFNISNLHLQNHLLSTLITILTIILLTSSTYLTLLQLTLSKINPFILFNKPNK